MLLVNTNLIKIFILHLCKEFNVMISASEVFAAMKSYGVDDVSTDLLSKTLQNMVSDGTLECNDGKYIITEQGYFENKKAKMNLSSFVTLLEGSFDDLMNKHDYSIPAFLDSIVAFKTVPYRVDSLDNKTEADFFNSKIEADEPYRFQGRGLGKSRFAMENGLDQYSYNDYAILFFNAGLAQYVGFVNKYDNTEKTLLLDSVIRLKNPISIIDIRNEVRENFNGSQQKQELFLPQEVDVMIELLKKKISKYGYELYKRGN